MPRAIADVDTLRQYVSGVMQNAEHHANGVDEVILTIAGAILWRQDDDTEIEVFERAGSMKNVAWIRVGGQRYALSYNHTTGSVEVREGNTQGRPVASFDNGSTAADVKRFFGSLQEARDDPV